MFIPYCTWSSILTIFKIVKGEYEIKGIISLVIDVLLAENNSVLWFVRVLFIYILLYPLFRIIIRKKTICLLLISIIFLINMKIGPTTGYSSVRYWLPIYIFGAFLGHYFSEYILEPRHFSSEWQYIVIGLLIIIFVLLGSINDYCLYICRMVVPFLFWIVADIFASSKKPQLWMKQSFFYYCTQLLVTSPISKIYIRVFGNGKLSALLAHIVIPLMMLLCLILLFYVLKKISPKLMTILTGRRG